MSHIVTIATQIRDETAVRAACRRLALPPPVEREVQLFSGSVRGLAVQLPDWRYPLVIDLATGGLRYDNYQQRWGADRHLDALRQAYAVEKAHLEARRQGHTVHEEALADGSVKLKIQLGDAS